MQKSCNKQNFIKVIVYISFLFCFTCANAESVKQAQWISVDSPEANNVNTWLTFRKDVTLKKAPKKLLWNIAVDSKYWLWINGKEVIFEGQLKRGPKPGMSYYDEINVAPYLQKGNNQIAILVWHFGKDGFSHQNSGQSGLIINCLQNNDFNTDSSWYVRIHPAFSKTDKPDPNFRLAESNIRYDAQKELTDWQTQDPSKFSMSNAIEKGSWGCKPWGELEKRPTPQWKDYGKKSVKFERNSGTEKDTIKAYLPYNMQMTPILDITDAKGGQLISIMTNHTFAASTENIRAEYITKQGNQTYESLGWMNGEELILIVPKDVTVNNLQYRETGYDTYPQGTFTCSDPFFMRFWEKALRTLYVNMRDTYFDCPDRERAQWWGDAVVLMGESFYTYSTSSHALMKKAIYELCNWQKPDGALYAPIPAGNWDKELPGQMLAAISLYGFWNYYMNTGDIETIRMAYPHVKRYLSLWKLDENGLTLEREGGWNWGDWGDNRDMRLIFAGWHHIALNSAAHMAELLGKPHDANNFKNIMESVKKAYNQCWNGTAYRHPSYKQDTDDRVQALAVISGIAPKEYYPAIAKCMESHWHASPYMEKYVMESLFRMGYEEQAISRVKERLTPMVEDSIYTTLYEGWGIGSKGYGGGTTNHAWSGGALTVLAQFLCGISPIEPAYRTFSIKPQPASMESASISIPTVSGTIKSAFVQKNGIVTLSFSVPKGTTALVYVPAKNINDIKEKSVIKKHIVTNAPQPETNLICLKFTKGEYTLTYRQ